jgi:hypothetical protein
MKLLKWARRRFIGIPVTIHLRNEQQGIVASKRQRMRFDRHGRNLDSIEFTIPDSATIESLEWSADGEDQRKVQL